MPHPTPTFPPYPLPAAVLQPARLAWPDATAPVGDDPHRLDLQVHRPGPRPCPCPSEPAAAAPQLLGPLPAMAELWRAPRPVRRGIDGPLRWACDGDWLHARVHIDEAGEPDGLIGASRRAYATLFALMAHHGLTQPARFWNYLAEINAETDSPQGRLERYRQFNIGRQQAFATAGQAACDGAPAACALGTEAGALSVALLAGRIAPRPIENPRQVSAYRYPSDYGPVSPTFSRAAELRLSPGHSLLFVSGTASIVGHASMHLGDVAEQTREALRNIDVLLAQVETGPVARPQSESGLAVLRATLDLTVYLRTASDLSPVRSIIAGWLRQGAGTPGQRAAAQAALDRCLWLRADVCRAELLVEIEAQAAFGPAVIPATPEPDHPHGASA
ncbi:chorismate transformation enzyme, FkbO/Hyg5 family [Leptothrix discophora]|uniref:Chorismatase FkbO/Hyg5-like N-terminal domain-containing protein n=1 Tax=Leptothrix discophora TaxID=89 RepID=A0ABT9G8W1_LEPDI|nr:hypothetical protein [Leptothrix discophora]MDP4302903.1 hypothetical protein [Leptothrix discophora]